MLIKKNIIANYASQIYVTEICFVMLPLYIKYMGAEAVALVGGVSLFAASGYIAHEWLQVSQLPIAEVQTAIQLMAIIFALRWMCGYLSQRDSPFQST